MPDGLDAEATAAQLSRIETMLGETVAPTGTRTPKNGKKEPIPDHVRKEAAKYGYRDARTFFERVYKPRLARQKR